MAEGDIAWRRPGHTDPSHTEPGYAGPPVADPPAPTWRPSEHEPVSTPRSLPTIDHTELDRAEAAAARFTYGVGSAAIAILLAIACSQAL